MTEIDEPRIIPTEDIQLQVFLKQIAEQITDEELKTLKFLLSGNGGMGKSMREQITNVLDLFYHLKELRLLSPNNLVTLQALIWHLGRKDLYRQFVDFCETHPSTLHFYAPSETPVNGFRYVHFHLRGTVACSRDKIQRLRNQISILLCCPIDYIIPDGIVPTGSVLVTFMIPEWCIDVLMKIRQEDKARLNSFGVDTFKIDNDYVDCKDFQERDERPDMDKDTAVDKIMQENKQLATDLEHFQVSYYKSKRALKEMKSQYDNAMQKADLTRSEVEELKEDVADLSACMVELKDTIENKDERIYSLNQMLDSSTDNGSCQEDILYRRNETQLFEENLHDLEQQSCFIQANLIEILSTSKACEITTEIMSRFQLVRQDSVDLKRHIRTLVGNQDFEEVYKEVEYLRRITNAITFQQTLEGENF